VTTTEPVQDLFNPTGCPISHFHKVNCGSAPAGWHFDKMWHERIPDYRLAPGQELVEHGGQIGMNALRLEWDV